jgi:hypothetical protein
LDPNKIIELNKTSKFCIRDKIFRGQGDHQDGSKPALKPNKMKNSVFYTEFLDRVIKSKNVQNQLQILKVGELKSSKIIDLRIKLSLKTMLHIQLSTKLFFYEISPKGYLINLFFRIQKKSQIKSIIKCIKI